MKANRQKLVFVPLGDVDYFMINKLGTQLSAALSLSSSIVQGMKIPPEAYNPRRAQYYSTVILQKLEIIRSNQRELMLGILEEDLYNAKGAFVLSEFDRLTSCAVVSLYRVRSEFYGLPEDESKVYPRLYKESFKLFAQLIGLHACKNPHCVLYFSDNMLDIDDKQDKFCDVCRRDYYRIL